MKHPRPIMILYCVCLHSIWACIILWDHSAIGATAVDALFKVFGSYEALSFALLTTSIMALVALFTRVPWAVVLLVPQQSLLLISAAGAIGAMVLSQFADGVVRPRAFIIADQMHIVLAALGHAFAIVAAGVRAGVRDE